MVNKHELELNSIANIVNQPADDVTTRAVTEALAVSQQNPVQQSVYRHCLSKVWSDLLL